MKPVKNKFLFYLLSFTWGLPMTLIGMFGAVALRIAGCNYQKVGYCYHFETGYDWGGVSLGMFIFTQRHAVDHITFHEHGHAFQNCYLGFLMPFIVGLPSAIRYQYRKIRAKRGNPCKTKYDAIWFEGSATKLGTNFLLNEQND